MRRKSVILVILFVLAISNIASARSERIQVSMNGNSLSVMQAPIVMNGKKMSSTIPSFVHNNRTLVHIRFIEENSDAKVGWEPATKTITVDYEENQVKLSIDNAMVTINGEKRILDKGSIPRLVEYEGESSARTMVPLRFLSEALGFEVGWDSENNSAYINSKVEEVEEVVEEKPMEKEEEKEELVNVEKNTIKSIGVFTGSTDKNKLIVESDKKLSYTTKYVDGENKLIIDIIGSKLELKNTKDAAGAIYVDDNYIKEVKYSQLSYQPYITRIVVELKKYKEASIIAQTDGTGLMIAFENQNIKEIKKELIDGTEAIVIKGAREENMNIIKLQNPQRLVIDLLDATLDAGTYKEYDHKVGFINKVRASQFSSDNNYSVSDQIVRVVLDIEGGMEDPNIKIETRGDDLVIFPEASLWENIELLTDGKEKTLTIKNIIDSNYDVEYDQASKNLKISLPSASTELSSGTIIVKDGLIDEIEVIEKNGRKEIIVKAVKSLEYQVISKAVDKNIVLKIERNKDLKPADRLIVIDAGHGGKDSGAVSPNNKRKEKDFNLPVSKKFNEKLKALGYNTIMTRDTDVFIDLYERPRIANENYADVFVSIHANAFTNNPAIEGIEVLYAPSYDSETKKENPHPFSKIMLEELLNATGAKSRGTIKRPKLVVLRESKMPAVLVEGGFLTNVREEQLLFTENYQDKIVDAMVKAVERYFEID